MRFLAGFFSGLIWSNWVEYAYHRWAMHWPSVYQPAAMRHALHHSAPSNPQYITMTIRFWTAIFAINFLLFAIPDRLLHLEVLTGMAAAFLTYIVAGVKVHRRIHDGRWVPDAWRAHHLSHHVSPHKNFNIFLPIFDSLLGSKNSISHVPRSRLSKTWNDLKPPLLDAASRKPLSVGFKSPPHN